MLTLLVEYEGAVFSTARASQMLPDTLRGDLARVESCLHGCRCGAHGTPSATVHVSLRPVRIEVDEPCCPDLPSTLRTALVRVA